MIMNKVFVYGSLLFGLGNHGLLRNSRLLGEDETKDLVYTMYDLGNFPGVVLEGKDRIYGEVYEVDDLVFHNLDTLEGYPNFYSRKEVDLVHNGTAWMYYLNNKDRYKNYNTIPLGGWKDHLLSDRNLLRTSSVLHR